MQEEYLKAGDSSLTLPHDVFVAAVPSPSLAKTTDPPRLLVVHARFPVGLP